MVVAVWFWLKVVVVLFGFIFVISLLQFFMSVHPPRYYSSDTPAQYGLPYENVSFKTTDGLTIKGWLISSKTAKGTVVVGHGYPFDKGNILHVVRFLYPDYSLLLYDHRYFGESEGKITTVGVREVKDVEAAVNFVRKRFGENEPVALYGFSLSASAMLMAKPSKVRAIIADSPYADLERMTKHVYKVFGPLKFPFVKLTTFFARIFLGINVGMESPLKAVEDIDIPVFVIHGGEDSQIPVENSRALKERNSDIELWIVNGVDHGQAYAFASNEYERRVKDFLRENMGR